MAGRGWLIKSNGFHFDRSEERVSFNGGIERINHCLRVSKRQAVVEVPFFEVLSKPVVDQLINCCHDKGYSVLRLPFDKEKKNFGGGLVLTRDGLRKKRKKKGGK